MRSLEVYTVFVGMIYCARIKTKYVNEATNLRTLYCEIKMRPGKMCFSVFIKHTHEYIMR